ncbi:hypothetical protein VEHSUH05_05790 [Veillonella denticariosi JCM 15641]|uniref:Uncharacterized protein n=1 Tax=Veillonella denticariosi JCM 15641 TaxID=1298594 RepID=A0A2S7Z6I4_9FIRM|nr:hypothetical protein [Veillonella denticariosi]PQL18886.1 hypothetical protein VEHSUH05_05790 [Veillonella denticariosi JCM 15641]
MSLNTYKERVWRWIYKQRIVVSHYKIAVISFTIVTCTILGIGLIFPYEEESIHLSSVHSESESKLEHSETSGNQSSNSDNQRSNRTHHSGDTDKRSRHSDTAEQSSSDSKSVKGRLLYGVSSVERAYPWREVFKELPLSGNVDKADMDIKDEPMGRETYHSLKNRRDISQKKVSRHHENNYESTKEVSNSRNKTDRRNHSEPVRSTVQLVGIIEGETFVAVLRSGAEECSVTTGTKWKGITVKSIGRTGVEIVEGGQVRWLTMD